MKQLTTVAFIVFFLTVIPFAGAWTFGYIALISASSFTWARWATGGLAVASGCVCIHQVGFWRDDGALMSRVLAVDGERNFVAQQTLALHLFERQRSVKDVQLAERHFTRAYELKPQLCQSLALAYLMILGESGHVERMGEVENQFVQWLHRRHNVWNSIDQDIAFGLVNLYREGT